MPPQRSPHLAFALLQLTLLCPSAVGAHDGSHEQIDRLTMAISAAPTTATLYSERAAAYRNDEDFDEAIDDYERAIRLEPFAHGVSIQYAETLLEAGRVRQGLEVIESFMREHANDSAAHLVYARILTEMGSHDEAARSFRYRVVATDKPSPDVILQWSNALAASGKSSAAITALEHGCALLGRLMIFEERIIALEAKLGHFESALGRIERLIAGTARKERLLTMRGEVLEAAGRPNEASVAYEEALDHLATLPLRLQEIPASRKLATLLRSRIRSRSESFAPAL